LPRDPERKTSCLCGGRITICSTKIEPPGRAINIPPRYLGCWPRCAP
jgi:hypothetical protein